MNETEKQIYQSGGVVEDFVEQDGRIFQVRHQDAGKFFKVMDQIKEINERGTRRPEIRFSYSIPEVLFPEIARKHGPDMHPQKYPKMSAVDKEKFKRIIRTEYPKCIVGGFSKRFI